MAYKSGFAQSAGFEGSEFGVRGSRSARISGASSADLRTPNFELKNSELPSPNFKLSSSELPSPNAENRPECNLQ